MPTEKPKITFVADKDIQSKIEDFRFENRINTMSEAIRILINAGLKTFSKKKIKKS